MSSFSNTTNGIEALNNAIADTTVSIVGGVTAVDATYGVYASLTGGDDVKLYTGDTSVTFNNGITVSFNELTAADLDTTHVGGTMAGLANTTTQTFGSTGSVSISYSNFSITDDDHTDGGAMSIVNNAGVLEATIGSKTYTWDTTTAAGSAQLAELNHAADAQVGDEKTITATFEAADGSRFTLDITSSVTAAGDGATTPTAYTATSGHMASTGSGTVTASGHNFSNVFGNTSAGLNDNGTSSFTVVTAANEGLTFQIGANSGDELVVNVEKFDAQFLGVNSAKVSTQDAASAAIEVVDNAINQVSTQRAYLGAIQNRLGYKINNLDTSFENLTSAESQIRDIDMAKEMTEFTNAQILSQAATSMLAQANSLPQNVLSLIGG
jgi:flagellin